MPGTIKKSNPRLSKQTYHGLSRGLLPDEKIALKRIYIRSLRREQQRGPPIFFDHPIDARAMRGVVSRLKKERDARLAPEAKKTKYIASSERLRGKISAAEIATRIIAKDLLIGIKGLNSTQSEILTRLITSRDKHRFPGTKIRVEADRRYLLLKLVTK